MKFFDTSDEHHVSYKDLYTALKTIIEEDVYLNDCLQDRELDELVYVLELRDLIWLASDGRLIVTQKGLTVFNFLVLPVAISKNGNKFIF